METLQISTYPIRFFDKLMILSKMADNLWLTYYCRIAWDDDSQLK